MPYHSENIKTLHRYALPEQDSIPVNSDNYCITVSITKAELNRANILIIFKHLIHNKFCDSPAVCLMCKQPTISNYFIHLIPSPHDDLHKVWLQLSTCPVS